MEDQEYSTRSRVHYHLSQSSFSPGAPACSVSSPNNGESIQRPLTTPDRPQPGKKYQFISEYPNNTTPTTKKPRSPEKLQAIESIKAAGGSCVWCRVRKKGCSSTTPCAECTRTHRPCLRDSSLCLANPTRNDTQFQLSDEVFRHARETLKNFRDEHIKESLVGNETVSVECVPFNGIIRTWSKELDQLQHDEIDDGARTLLVDIALQSISIPLLEQSGHFDDDSLYKDAYVMFRLVAAIEKISQSLLTIEPMDALTSQFVMFLMLTIYTMKITEVSISFVSCLEGAIRDNRLREYPVQWAVEIYRQLIQRLASFQKQDSFLSDLFCEIRPRLIGIQTGIAKILSTLPREQHIVFLSISEIWPFQITVRITSERNLWGSSLDSRHDMISDEFPFGVKYVDTSLKPYTGGSAIDPRLLTIQGLPRSGVPSTRTSTIGADNNFSAPGGSQETNTTATTVSSANSEDVTSNTIVGSYEDLLGLGVHLLY